MIECGGGVAQEVIMTIGKIFFCIRVLLYSLKSTVITVMSGFANTIPDTQHMGQ